MKEKSYQCSGETDGESINLQGGAITLLEHPGHLGSSLRLCGVSFFFQHLVDKDAINCISASLFQAPPLQLPPELIEHPLKNLYLQNLKCGHYTVSHVRSLLDVARFPKNRNCEP